MSKIINEISWLDIENSTINWTRQIVILFSVVFIALTFTLARENIMTILIMYLLFTTLLIMECYGIYELSNRIFNDNIKILLSDVNKYEAIKNFIIINLSIMTLFLISTLIAIMYFTYGVIEVYTNK